MAVLELPFNIETFKRLDSTQDEMVRRLKAGQNVHGLVIRAEAQTQGRGTRGRDWQSGFGGSYQTLAVRDAAGVLKHSASAIYVALGLAETLPEYGVQLGVKWPNDLHYRSKKVAGVLCEYRQSHLLAAVGINVNNDVPPGSARLRGLDTEGVSNMVLAGMQRGLELLVGGANLPEAFARFDVLAGKLVSCEVDGQMVMGVADGIDERGCLRLKAGTAERICQSKARTSLRVFQSAPR